MATVQSWNLHPLTQKGTSNHVGGIRDCRAVLSHLFLSHVLWTSSSSFFGLLHQRSVKRQGDFLLQGLQIYVDSPRFHDLPPNQISSFYVPSCLALFHLSSHRPVPSGASGFPCKVTRVQVAQWVHICGTRRGCCFCSCQATLGSWPKCSIHALIVAWSKKTYWLVVSTLKNMKVSWDDYSQDMENRACSKTTNQQKVWPVKNHQGWTCELGIQGGLSGFFASLDGGCPETGPRTGTPPSIRLGLTRSAKCDCLYHCSFGPLLIVDGFSWLSAGLLST